MDQPSGHRFGSLPVPQSRSSESKASSDSVYVWSFRWSFHLGLLGPTGAYWLGDPPDASCKDSTRQHADLLLSCKSRWARVSGASFNRCGLEDSFCPRAREATPLDVTEAWECLVSAASRQASWGGPDPGSLPVRVVAWSRYAEALAR
jgi:hypothetical protein